MEIAYQNNQQCLHIVAIDRLPGDAAVAFHGTTDPLSSPFRNAFLLFSINRPPKFPNRYAGKILVAHFRQNLLSFSVKFLHFHCRTSQRDMEKHLRRHLRLLWEGDLGGDEASALINRLTVRIGIFKVWRNYCSTDFVFSRVTKLFPIRDIFLRKSALFIIKAWCFSITFSDINSVVECNTKFY